MTSCAAPWNSRQHGSQRREPAHLRCGKDLLEPAHQELSEAAGGGTGNGASSWAVLSADGTRAAFDSAASDLAPNDTNGTGDVFARRLRD